ncbi:MAG: hypothetical protein EBR09_15940 [Proteobacteria bacterium]|nr:hypothetical protein [Pseudomonadota bacterium]
MIGFFNKILVIILIVTGASFISGCLLRSAAFSNANALIRYEIGSTFDTDEEQNTFLKREVPKFLGSLKTEDVPRLKTLLADIVAQSERPLGKDAVLSIFERWDEIYAAVLRRAGAPVGEFLSRMRKEQVEQWAEFQSGKNKTRFEDSGKGEKSFIQKKSKEFAKRVSSWIGVINSRQMAAVEEYAAKEFFLSVREQQSLPESQRRLRQAVLDSSGAKRLEEIFIRQQLFPFSELHDDHAKVRLERRTALLQLINVIAQSLGEDQKKTLKREVESLTEDLSRIGP